MLCSLARASSTCPDLVELRTFKDIVKANGSSAERKRNSILAGLLGLQMLEKVDFVTVGSSVIDVIDKMIKAICSMPVKLAASMDADNLEDVAKDCAKLHEALFKITSASYGSFCIGDVFAAMGPPIPEEVLSMASQVSAVCDSIKYVNILSPYVAAKLTTTSASSKVHRHAGRVCKS